MEGAEEQFLAPKGAPASGERSQCHGGGLWEAGMDELQGLFHGGIHDFPHAILPMGMNGSRKRRWSLGEAVCRHGMPIPDFAPHGFASSLFARGIPPPGHQHSHWNGAG